MKGYTLSTLGKINTYQHLSIKQYEYVANLARTMTTTKLTNQSNHQP